MLRLLPTIKRVQIGQIAELFPGFVELLTRVFPTRGTPFRLLTLWGLHCQPSIELKTVNTEPLSGHYPFFGKSRSNPAKAYRHGIAGLRRVIIHFQLWGRRIGDHEVDSFTGWMCRIGRWDDEHANCPAWQITHRRSSNGGVWLDDPTPLVKGEGVEVPQWHSLCKSGDELEFVNNEAAIENFVCPWSTRVTVNWFLVTITWQVRMNKRLNKIFNIHAHSTVAHSWI